MYKRILIVTGNRDADRAALKEGLALAKVHSAEVLLYHVLPNYAATVADMAPMLLVSPKDFRREARREAKRIIGEARMMAYKAGIGSLDGIGDGTDAAECVASAAKIGRCDLIVVGTEGRNALTRLIAGSVIPGLITRSTVPVLVCRKRPGSRVAKRAPIPIRPRNTRLAAVAKASRSSAKVALMH